MVLLSIMYCQLLVDYFVDGCCLLAAVARLFGLYLSSASMVGIACCEQSVDTLKHPRPFKAA